MGKVALFATALLFTGCVCLDPAHKKTTAPSVSTTEVINSLNDTKQELVQAGESNTKVGQQIDKALTLAERLDVLLEQIEKESAKTSNKNVIKPE